jgi:predicted esterase
VVIERTVAVTTHGRYLAEVPSIPGPWPLLVGFHGYAEGADAQLERLRSIPGAGRWLLVAVQGLHRFYRGRTDEVIASWMTRQDRELAIADNVAYVAAVVDAVSREWTVDGRVVYAGFSQGVATAFRAAARRKADGVIALGGDVPPELDRAALSTIPVVLIGRGLRDAWYSSDTFDADVGRLRAAGAHVEAASFDAPHEWTPEFSRAAAPFLARWR